jgi:hypothetical protein
MRACPHPRTALVAALALLAVLAPLALSALDPVFLSHSYGRRSVHFELFAAFASLAAGITAALELRARRGRPAAELVPVLAPLLVTLLYAFLIGEYSRKPFDYDCYEYAGRPSAGREPYVVGLLYLYLPLTADPQPRIGAGVGGGLPGQAPDPEAIWGTVFYLFQCVQLGLILLLYALSTRFARAVGMQAGAHAVVALLLLVDNPL